MQVNTSQLKRLIQRYSYAVLYKKLNLFEAKLMFM